MGLLRLAVLGSPEVSHDGRRLMFSLPRALALLLDLAVEGGMHPRSKLAAFLWPDSEPHDARTALRNAIALLRSLLADASPSQHTHLLSEHELLGLDPHASVELDLDVVQQAWKQAEELQVEPTPEIVNLAEHIRAAEARSTRLPPPPSTTAAESRPPSVLVAPLVGRAAAFTQLASLYQQARQGQPQAVLVVGEAGIGKTRLAPGVLGWDPPPGAGGPEGEASGAGGEQPH